MPATPSIDDLLPLPRATFHVLLALQEGPLHGYGVKQRVESLSGGKVRMAPATLYETLHRMLSNGLLEESPPTDEAPQGGGAGRGGSYRLSPRGHAVLVAEVERLGAMIDHARRLLEARA